MSNSYNIIEEKIFCTHHLSCGNIKCEHKPTNGEIQVMQDRSRQRIKATWGDFHIPWYGLKCDNFKEL